MEAKQKLNYVSRFVCPLCKSDKVSIRPMISFGSITKCKSCGHKWSSYTANPR